MAPPIFSLTFDGRKEPYLTDTQGRNGGVNPVNGFVELSIPGANVEPMPNPGVSP